MHFIQGFILTIIFQPAHVMPTSEYPIPDINGNVENNWAIHQMLTTSDFSPKSRVFSWYIGGLNYQIEHHLFPNICHIHYRKLSKIVKETAKEFGIPYHVQSNFLLALINHGRMLKRLGRNDLIKT
jgi:linoleoyl-CoA desaturase